MALPTVSLADEEVVTRVEATPTGEVFEESSRGAALELATAEDAAEYFEEGQLASLNEQVDWETQTVLIFAWRGSGGDRMDVEITGEMPKEVRFVYRPGRTRDLRPHVYVFAVNKDVKWEIGGGPGPGPG